MIKDILGITRGELLMKQKTIQGIVIILSLLMINLASASGISQLNEEKTGINIQNLIGQPSQKIRSNSLTRLLNNILSLQKQIDLYDLLTSTIRTTCSGVEKTSKITFGMINAIDVDGDESTGINGNDIQVQYYLIPHIEIDPAFILGLKFVVNIQRIGEEIKETEFNITATLGNDLVSVGYWAPEKSGNEIPTHIQLSVLLFYNMLDSSKGFTISMEPTYATNIGNKKLVFFNSYTSEDTVQHSHFFSFDPPSKTQMTISSTKDPNEWNYKLTRNTEYDTILTMGRSRTLPTETKETILTFNKFPRTVSFSLRITPFSSEGGSVYYTSDSMYDMDVLIETNELGACNYAIIKNTPRMLFAEWLPVKERGWYHLEIDSDGTDISLLDSLENPTIDLSMYGVTDVDLTAFWNFTNPGDLRIVKDPSFHIDLAFIIGVWEARLDARPVAEEISVSWLTDITGYLTYDTNWQPLNQMDLLIRGSDTGIRTVAETFKAEDFRLDWTIWPPIEWNINSTGDIDFLSMLIEVYIGGQWYRLWPWV
ncbi:MAG: hypothetical protein QCH96_01845 [Candidatus Thermoplasmatota archaeon]|nr:hypothetical protein [Candidatus Thermoplasmatota archaeon]